MRKNKDIKLAIKEKKKLFGIRSKLSYYKVLAIEMKKCWIIMNKPVYLELSVLELRKTVMYQFWDGCVKPKYGEKAKLCQMDTGNFIVHL